jgi:hypothetical protein
MLSFIATSYEMHYGKGEGDGREEGMTTTTKTTTTSITTITTIMIVLIIIKLITKTAFLTTHLTCLGVLNHTDNNTLSTII